MLRYAPLLLVSSVIGALMIADAASLIGDEPLGIRGGVRAGGDPVAPQASVATSPTARTPEAAFLRADLNGDEMLTGKELKATHDYDDADLDGAVLRAEYLATRAREKQLLADIRKQGELEGAFRTRDTSEDGVLTGTEKAGAESLDADGDGRITFAEFLTGSRSEPAKSARGKKADTSTLSEEILGGELGGRTPKTRSPPVADGEEAEDLKKFVELDANEDGKLSGTELEGYKAGDLDGDKRLTRAEFLTLVAERRADPQTKIAMTFDRGSTYYSIVGVSGYKEQTLPWACPGTDLIWTNLKETKAKKLFGIVRGDVGRTESLPTKGTLETCYDAPRAQVEEADVAVFVFSGRVTSIGGRAYLCPLEFDAEQPQSTGYALGELLSSIEKYKSKRKLLIIEGASFAKQAANAEKAEGGAAEMPRKSAAADVSPVLDDAFALPPTAVPGLITLLSCSPGEVSVASPRANAGAFIDAVAAALAGRADYGDDGIVDTDELFAYLTSAVPHAARRSDRDARQTPRRIIGRETEGAFGLVRYRPEIDPVDAPDVVESKQPKELVNSLGQRLMRLPPAKFWVGSHAEAPQRENDEWLRKAQLTTSFYMSMHEVTQKQFEAVMKSNMSFHGPARGYLDTHPAEQVSWHDAVEFCRRLSAVPAEVAAGRSYRLPTEFEWERACGTDAHDPERFRHFHTGATITAEQANIRADRPYADSPAGTALGRTQPCGSYPPNAYGLCDMHGNVSEWCADWYLETHVAYGDPTHFVVDYPGPPRGERRVVRGGDYNIEVTRCRGAARQAYEPDYTDKSLGFRVVCDFKSDPTGRKPSVVAPETEPQ